MDLNKLLVLPNVVDGDAPLPRELELNLGGGPRRVSWSN